jgi:hypothetical protein
MHKDFNDTRDVLLLAEGLIYFVFIGAATVAIALAAHIY